MTRNGLAPPGLGVVGEMPLVSRQEKCTEGEPAVGLQAEMDWADVSGLQGAVGGTRDTCRETDAL